MKSNLAFTSDLTQGQSSPDSDDQLQETLAERLDIRSFEESRTVDDIVYRTPLSEFTRAMPWPVSEHFETHHSYPTLANYWDDYVHYSGLTTAMTDISQEQSRVIFPKREDWIEIGSLFFNEEGGQRLQIKDPKEAKVLRDHAWNFRFDLVNLKVAECSPGFVDDDGHERPEMSGKRFITDGGGTCIKARLRGITHLPAQLVIVSTEQQLRDQFYDINTKRNPVKGVELFKKRLVERDPLARLQDRLMERSGVTPIKYHTDSTLVFADLGPTKKVLEGTFKGIDKTSWSGDSVEQVKDPSQFHLRKAETLTFSMDSLRSLGEGYIHSGLCVAIAQFKAVWNGTITFANFQEFLTDIRSLKHDGTPSWPIKTTVVDPGALRGYTCRWESQKQMSNTLNLTRMQTEKAWGVVSLSRAWNAWAKMKRYNHLMLDDGHINSLLAPNGFRPYH